MSCVALAKRSVTSTIPSTKAKLRTRDSSAWSAWTSVKVNCANSDTEPDTSQRTTTSGRWGWRLRQAGSSGTPPDWSERRAVVRGVQPAGRLLTAPAADAGRELPGQRLDRPPELVQLDRGQLEQVSGHRRLRRRRGSPALGEPVGDLGGQLPAELLEQPGQLLALEQQLQLGQLLGGASAAAAAWPSPASAVRSTARSTRWRK